MGEKSIYGLEEFVELFKALEERVREIVEENFERVRDELLKETCKPEDYQIIKE